MTVQGPHLDLPAHDRVSTKKEARRHGTMARSSSNSRDVLAAEVSRVSEGGSDSSSSGSYSTRHLRKRNVTFMGSMLAGRVSESTVFQQ